MLNVSQTAPGSNDEAERQLARDKWQRFHIYDPLPDIPRTLLSGVDIATYVEKVGLIYPFHDEGEHVKAASYEVGFGSRVIYWDENENKIVKTSEENGTFN